MKYVNPQSASCQLRIKRNKLSYLLISFAMGISSIGDLAVSYFLKDNLGLEPWEMSRLYAILMLPWMIKPLLGLITDCIPLCGYRRKNYVIISGISGILCGVLMACYVETTYQITLVLFISSLAGSFASVLGEAIVVELSNTSSGESMKLNEEYATVLNEHFQVVQGSSNAPNNAEKAKQYVSLFFLVKNIGVLISAFFRGYLVDIMPLRLIFLLTGIVYILTLIAGLIMIEDPIESESERKSRDKDPSKVGDSEEINYYSLDSDEKGAAMETLLDKRQKAQRGEICINKKQLFKDFLVFLQKTEVIVPSLFIVFLYCTPNFGDPFFYYMTNFLLFTPSQLGLISLTTALGVVLAILSYRAWFKSQSFKAIVSSSTFLFSICSFLAYALVMRYNVTFFQIPDFTLCIIGFSCLSILGELSMLPILSLACTICPKNLEGTVYSYFMSSLNSGLMISSLSGSFLTNALEITAHDFTNLPILIIICNILKLFPIVVLFFIDRKFFEPGKNKDNRFEQSLILKLEEEEMINGMNPNENIKKIII